MSGRGGSWPGAIHNASTKLVRIQHKTSTREANIANLKQVAEGAWDQKDRDGKIRSNSKMIGMNEKKRGWARL